MNSQRNGVILAAGMGIRLRSFQSPSMIHKALLPVGNMPLIIRVIHSLEKASCKKVLIVLGWQGEILKQAICKQYKGKARLDFVFNADYRLQNGLSVLSARNWVSDEYLLTMADHILDDRILKLIQHHSPLPGGATLCVDFKLKSVFDMEDATKVLSAEGFVKDIGKDLGSYNCVDTGIFIATRGLMDAIQSVYEEQGDASLTDGVKYLAVHNRMQTLDIGDAFWQDVDTPEMLSRAEDIVREHKTL